MEESYNIGLYGILLKGLLGHCVYLYRGREREGERERERERQRERARERERVRVSEWSE